MRRDAVGVNFNFVQTARQLRPDDALHLAIVHRTTAASSVLARASSDGRSVKISQPSAVTVTVCSKCADRLPSRVTAV